MMRGILYSLVLLSIAVGVVLYVRVASAGGRRRRLARQRFGGRPRKPRRVGDILGKRGRRVDHSRSKNEVARRFSYTDPRGKTWLAPENSVVDGAVFRDPERLWILESCQWNIPRKVRNDEIKTVAGASYIPQVENIANHSERFASNHPDNDQHLKQTKQSFPC